MVAVEVAAAKAVAAEAAAAEVATAEVATAEVAKAMATDAHDDTPTNHEDHGDLPSEGAEECVHPVQLSSKRPLEQDGGGGANREAVLRQGREITAGAAPIQRESRAAAAAAAGCNEESAESTAGDVHGGSAAGTKRARDRFEARDRSGDWFEAKVVKERCEGEAREVLVHFTG